MSTKHTGFTKSMPNQMQTKIAQLPTVGTTVGVTSAGITAGKLLIVAVAVLGGLAAVAALVVPLTLYATKTGPFATTVTTVQGTNGTTVITTTTTTTTTVSTTTTVTTTTTATTTTSSSSECSTYTTINDATRLTSAAGGSICDSSMFTSSITWVRFTSPGGTQLATSAPNANQCDTQATGWYNGALPSSGVSTSGTVCYVWDSNTCTWSNNILVTNCGSFYVFGLTAPPICDARYCTA